MNKLINLLFLLCISCSELIAQISPSVYYQFDESNPLAPTIGSTYLSGGGTYTINSGGKVGKYLEWSNVNTASQLMGATINATNGLSVQMLYKSTYNSNRTDAMILFSHPAVNIVLQYPQISLQTSAVEFNITLNGIGINTWGYLNDGNWHLLSFVYDNSGGKIRFYLDGFNPSNFTTNISTSPTIGENGTIRFSHTLNYVKSICAIDEIAVYNGVLSPQQIYKNYLDIQSGNHYTTANATPPSTPITVGNVDANEWADTSVSAYNQLTNYPIPRYKRNNTLHRNFNWVDLIYFGGRFQPNTSDAQSVTTSTNLNDELSANWNYGIYGITSTSQLAYRNAWRDLANAHPERDFNIITLRAQIGSLIKNQNQTSDKYLQNGSGTFIDGFGNTSSTKYWRPTNATTLYNTDGNVQKSEIESFISSGLTRPITTINENGELIPIYYDSVGISLDPAVISAKNASGLSWKEYIATRFYLTATQPYRDIILSSSSPQMIGTKYTEYQQCGFPNYQYNWKQARLVNSQINSQYYSTPDFYVRYPRNWKIRESAWHGLDWIQRGRYYELAEGDKLFSPFIAAGWNVNNETQNVSPTQWLGLLKILSAFGSEFYYTGYFNEQGSYNPPNPPPTKPSQYAWQVATPSYAQAISSKYEEFFRNGTLLEGDYPINYTEAVNPNNNPLFGYKPSYMFYTGDVQTLCAIRKLNGANKYIITTAIQRNSNQKFNNVGSKTATITLDGNTVKFQSRQQGSVYYYDNTDTNNPIFYQLDTWHDSTHYRLWTSDFNVENEVYDSISVNGASAKTYSFTGRDFTNSKTYMQFSNNGKIYYDYQPRTTATRYMYVYAKAIDTTSNIGFKVYLDGTLKATVSCIKDTTWKWYKFNSTDSTQITFTNLNNTKHSISIEGLTNKIAIDKFTISTNSNLYNTSPVTACGNIVIPPDTTTPTANISANGSTSFCTGNNVTLTGNTNGTSGISYLWSTGATTQSIEVATSGNYVVTITSNLGVATSIATTVTVYNSPSAVILIEPSLPQCTGTSMKLTATQGESYLWSTGQTSQIINTTTANSYTVTVNFGGNCKATSPPAVISYVNCTCPPPALTIVRTGKTHVIFIFTKTTGANAYYVEVSGGNLISPITYRYPSAKTRTISGLKANTNYKLRVKAKCGTYLGNYGNYVNFKTQQ